MHFCVIEQESNDDDYLVFRSKQSQLILFRFAACAASCDSDAVEFFHIFNISEQGKMSIHVVRF